VIRAVTFDFWATLYVHDSALEQVRKDLRVERLSDLPELYGIGAERLRERLAIACDMAFAGRREPFPPEVTKHLLRELGLGHDGRLAATITTLLEDAALDAPPPVIPGAVEVVRRLAQSDRIGIISDTGITTGRVLRMILTNDGIGEHMSAFVFSDETGRRKPDRHQFLTAAAELGVRPDEVVHVGDLLETDVVGAHSVGATAILYIGLHDDQAGKHEADAVVRDHAELPGMIEQLERGPRLQK
jgi:HAD superfamily hydrolase (TIGR01549 family)